MRLVIALLLGSSLALSATAARADRRDPVTAEALFRAGRAAADRGDFASACAQFEESNRLDPAVGTMFNLAACDEQLGKIASAWQLFREVAQRLPPGDERIALANTRANALEPKLPKIALQLASAPEGTVVLRDGVELGGASLGLPLPVDPGNHVIVVRSPGRAERRYEVTVGVAENREISLEAGAGLNGESVSPQSSTPAPDAAAQGGGRRTVGLVLMGAGGAGLVAGLAFGAVALSAKNTVGSECQNKQCSPAGLDAADRGRTAATVSSVAVGVGVVSAVVGGILWFGGGSTSAAKRSAPSLAFDVSPLQKGAFVSAVGRWQ